MINNLIQYFYCPECNDFYQENGIVFGKLNAYLTAEMNDNIGNCPIGHIRRIEKEYAVFLSQKPLKYSNSSILCFDCVKFSEKISEIQFNIQSLLQLAYNQIKTDKYNDVIYKGTGDGFILAFPNLSVDESIDFINILIQNYLSHLPHIKYRIGISYGTYFSYISNNTIDLFGKEIINVCRIADFGNNNTILLSSSAQINLNLFEKYKDNIYDIGNCIDKHRRPHKVYNYKDNNIGADFYN